MKNFIKTHKLLSLIVLVSFIGAIFIVVMGSLIIIKNEIFRQFDSPVMPEEETLNGESDLDQSACNVMGIELHGELVTYIPPTESDNEGGSLNDQVASQDIVYTIREAENDDDIKAIILEVDSYGGGSVSGEEVANALKKATKPTIALIREAGDSAAYEAASGADKIFASKNSEVGSIGVTMSQLNYAEQNKKEGITYIQLSSGKFKDVGDPERALSQEEKDYLMRDINIMHQNFVKTIAENRNLDIKKVEELADGSSMLGEMALQNGLIDQIGGMSEVEEYLKGKIGEKVEVCW